MNDQLTTNEARDTRKPESEGRVVLQRLVRPRYWVCIIGPIEDGKLPDGADSPPHMAARRAVVEMTGDDTTCNSGWCDEAEYRRIMDAKYRTNDNVSDGGPLTHD